VSRHTAGRSTSLRSRVVRLAAAILLAGLCIGLPIWLIVIGGVPFAHVDPFALVRAMTDRHGTDTRAVGAWLGQVALVIAWAAWAWTVTCIVMETRYWLSGRSPANLPASRTVQWLIACLVSTAFALGGAGRPAAHFQPIGGAVGAGFEAIPVVSVIDHLPLPTDRMVAYVGESNGGGGVSLRLGDLPAPTSPEDSAAPPPRLPAVHTQATDQFDGMPQGMASMPGPEVHVVSGRETLWSVAEQRLGSALRWKEIADLNLGRLQEGGGRLADDHWIQPGWELVLPGADGRPTAGTVKIRPPVTALLPGPATEAPTVGDIPASHPNPQAVPELFTQIHDARPNERTMGVGAPTIASYSVVSGATHKSLDPVLPAMPSVPVTPVGAGIVGVGVTGIVDRLRRVQQRHREAGARIRMPEPLLRQFEQRLRVGDGLDMVCAVDEAIARFHGSERLFAPLVTIVGATVSATEVRMVIASDGDGAIEAPEGFRSSEDGRGFTIERSPLAAPIQRSNTVLSGTVSLPTLVTVGTSDDEIVMVNLEALGSVLIAGDRQGAEGLARALALELATSRWSARFDLVLVGFGTDLERFERVSVVGSAASLVADLTWRRLRDTAALEDAGFASAAEARNRAGGARWDPVVVICGPDVAEEDAAAMLAVGGDGTGGIAVVVVGADSAPLRSAAHHVIRAAGDTPTPLLELFGELVEPQEVTIEDMDMVALLIEVATDTDTDTDTDSDANAESEIRAEADRVLGMTPGTPQLSSGFVERTGTTSAPVSQSSGSHASPRQPTHEVEIAVLGPVEIHGAARDFTRAWARELVVYLSVHPNGASNEAWATALWPERVMAPSSLHSTASVARRALGKAKDGSDHLPRSHGRLALASTVGTDWDRFVELSQGEDPDRWRQALELVRGRPFDGLRSTDWSILDGTAPSVESAIVDLSGRLAGACLRDGDARGAEWSARRGLMVSPYDERLYRMLLRAADAAGNPSGVEAVMGELVRVVADEIEPVESVHPSTLALYRSLSRRRSPVR
jgi:DNA-binding SARP family transcriptional activator